MSCLLKSGFFVSGCSHNTIIKNRDKGSFRVCSSIGSLQFKDINSKQFLGKSPLVSDLSYKAPKLEPVNAQSSVFIGKSLRWWEKSLHPNMIEIHSAQHFVDSLLSAGDKLVIVDFYSPGCGGCKALHPKICQLAEMNPDTTFLKVNYEEQKPMCYALRVHVLPFFRFYRGAEGRVCSFSCTNATIKKFKDALAKHGTDRCSLGPAKGLEESELLELASIGLISIDLLPSSTKDDGDKVGDLVLNENVVSNIGRKEGNAMVMA
ncbi:hypothetical protein ACJIZ3_005324 [Penstemon smallii]|uniref:Thioredoxin domain-containing protein n=1 Tax=Penstemon smallii TaxID=265156 RepID=A0ABD3S4N4_9LAMI